MKDTKKMVQLAVLVAIIAVMSFTPLGFLPIGPVTITLMIIPVAVAAIVVGPAGGAIAGGVWGLCAFLRIIFGLSPFFAQFLNINPIFTVVLMLFPRILAGWISGLVYLAFRRFKNKTLAAMAGSVAAPLCNTILFVGTWILLFGRTDLFIATYGDAVWVAIVAIIGINAPIEAAFGLLTGTAISRSLIHFFPDKKSVTEKG
ncbi:MAG: ECF transporter S component [Oscillospiraceae bacterium]|nr:ECF transporter S component [Oscillospiraceae bacterium]